MDVVEIPTNRPVIRKDLQDAVYKTKKEKFNAVVEAVEEAHAKGTAGTGRYDHYRNQSEELSSMLTRARASSTRY